MKKWRCQFAQQCYGQMKWRKTLFWLFVWSKKCYETRKKTGRKMQNWECLDQYMHKVQCVSMDRWHGGIHCSQTHCVRARPWPPHRLGYSSLSIQRYWGGGGKGDIKYRFGEGEVSEDDDGGVHTEKIWCHKQANIGWQWWRKPTSSSELKMGLEGVWHTNVS